MRSEVGADLIYFLSGEYFNIAENSWLNVDMPFTSFNIGSYDGKPIIIGEAQQNSSHIVGDKKIYVLDEVNQIN